MGTITVSFIFFILDIFLHQKPFNLNKKKKKRIFLYLNWHAKKNNDAFKLKLQQNKLITEIIQFDKWLLSSVMRITEQRTTTAAAAGGGKKAKEM